MDPALIRPGRIDRKIEFPLPDEKTKRRIFQIHASRMTLADDVTLDDLIMAKDDLSGADIKVRTWAGLYLLVVCACEDVSSQMTRIRARLGSTECGASLLCM